jgi:hypothetical protein
MAPYGDSKTTCDPGTAVPRRAPTGGVRLALRNSEPRCAHGSRSAADARGLAGRDLSGHAQGLCMVRVERQLPDKAADLRNAARPIARAWFARAQCPSLRRGRGTGRQCLMGYRQRRQVVSRRRPGWFGGASQPFVAGCGGNSATHNRAFIWTRPELVAQIRFVEWTAEGRLRHAAFLGLRSDKSAGSVHREL